MKNYTALIGTLAGAALAFGSIESNAENTNYGYNALDSQGAGLILLADNTSTTHVDASKPAMGGEGDGAIGGNAPNPDPDRSVSTVAEDATITAEVKAKLLADSKVSGLKIDVDTLSGVVYLTGDNMNTQSEIDQALKLAKGTEGVNKVVSKLAIGDIKN